MLTLCPLSVDGVDEGEPEMDSYLNQSWKQQWQRVLRFLERIDGPQGGSSDDYDDDLISFFMHCWHLKDWIKYDVNVDERVRKKIEDEVEKKPNLIMCADLANRSKHFTLLSKRLDAAITNRDVRIRVGDKRGAICEHWITCEDGSKYNAKDVARGAVKEWEDFLKSNSLI